MKKFIIYFFLSIIVVLLVMQFIKPDTKNPVEDKSKFITSHINIPDNVYSKLEQSCFDCHSYRTKWPWYSKISPVVYLLNYDVENGREDLNFSTWGDYDKSRMMDKLDGIETEVKDGEMPKSVYLPLHPEARLSETDIKMIQDWASTSKEQFYND